jgi:hypothetical protein
MTNTNTLLAAAARKGFTVEIVGKHTPISWVGSFVNDTAVSRPATAYMIAGDWQVTLEQAMNGEWYPVERHNTITGTQSKCGVWFNNLMK